MLNVIKRTLIDYAIKIRMFTPNARFYLINVIISGVAMGVFRLLFNFYALSLGFDEAFLGRLITISSLTSLLVALPMGYLADLLGRKNSLILSGLLVSVAIFGMVFYPNAAAFYTLQIILGIAQSLAAITMAPFLMENSDEQERTYLFSFGQGLQMLSSFVGNWLGGYLPTWFALRQGIIPTDSQAYAHSLLVVAGMYFLGLVPLIFLQRNRMVGKAHSVFAPIRYAKENPKLLGKLVVPVLVTSIGAGLIMPFMNVFFRTVHHQPDTTIGTMFAWGSLAMGIGLLIAPPLADRFGKIQVVVVTQALSVPFLILLGFSPWFWLSALSYYVRLALMNMSNPVFQTFVMENVDQDARATVASLTSMAWNFGWAFSPTISGILQVSYSFGPAFLGTILTYILAILMYWAFFWHGKPRESVAIAHGD